MKQKERFEHSRKELAQKIHRFPVCSVSPKRAEATVKTPPRLPSKPEKRPRPSPLARTGICPLTKRTLLADALERDGKQPVEAAQRLWTKPVARRELFPVPNSVQVSPSRIPIPSTKSKHFLNFKSNPFLPLKKKPKPYKKFRKWIIKRRKFASIQHQIATRVF